MLKVSQRGMAEIAAHEAIVLSPYKDSVGVWTVGIGHTARAGHPDPAKERREFSIDEIMGIFTRDIQKFESRVRKAFKRPLSQSQFDAAVSFDFNTGGIHRASWVKHFNKGDDARARQAFMLWRKPSQIIPRRQKERDLFFDGKYTSNGRVDVYPASSSGKVLLGKGKRIALPGSREPASKTAASQNRTNDQQAQPRRGLTKGARRVLTKDARRGLTKGARKGLTKGTRRVSSQDPQTMANPKSEILPLFRPKQADEITVAVLTQYAHLMPADRRDDAIKVLVTRGYFLNSMGRKGHNDRAIYDDAVFVVSPTGVQPFNGNSDPSVFRKRVASIKAGQAIRYRPGLHGYNRKGGPYAAFRQDAACTVVRDGVGDDTGLFHVNLHRGGVHGTSSLGCLTIPPHQWDEFYGLLSGLLKKYGQRTFYVTLLEYAGDDPPVDFAEPKTAPDDPAKLSKATTGLLVGGAVIVSAALENFSGWLSKTLAWIGGLL